METEVSILLNDCQDQGQHEIVSRCHWFWDQTTHVDQG